MKKYIFILSIFLGLAFIGVFLLFEGYIWFVYPDRAKYPTMGIDVSHHQGQIDWKKVKASGIDFAYLKSTEGGDWVDDRFDEYYSGARSENIPVGTYHFYSLRISPEKQFENIVRTLSGKTFDLPVAIDLEFGGNSIVRPEKKQFQKDLRKFLDRIETRGGKKPILYMTYEFREAYLGTDFDDYPIWIRDIFALPNIASWTLWQYKSRGHISGIDGFVDLNTIDGTLEVLSQKNPY